MRILSILLLTLIVFSSCSKQDNDATITEEETQKDNLDRTPLFNPTLSGNTEEIKDKIRMFGSRMEAVRKGEAGAKNGELSIEDATWSVEALLNASYANASVSMKELKRKEHQFTVTAENGTVSNEDLLAAFETSRAYLESDYNEIVVDNKTPLLIDLKEINVTSNSVDYKLVNIIAITKPTSESFPSHCNDPEPIFDFVTDWWHPNSLRGQCCEPYEGEGEIDAAVRLETEINERNILPWNHLFFTDVESVFIDPIFGGDLDLFLENPEFSQDFDHCRSHLLWSRESSSGCDCISPDDMDWYYCNITDLIEEQTPEGLNFVSIAVDDNLGGSFQFHSLFIHYGISVTCDDCLPCPPGTPTCPCLTSC